MINLGWPELLIIVAVAILVIGPKDLPVLMVGLGRVFKRIQYMKFALSRQFDEMMHDAGLSDLQDQVNFEAKDFDETAAGDEAHAQLQDPSYAHKTAIKERED